MATDPNKAYPAPPAYAPGYAPEQQQAQQAYYQPQQGQAYPTYPMGQAYPVQAGYPAQAGYPGGAAVVQTAPGGVSYIVPAGAQQYPNGQQVIVVQQAPGHHHHGPAPPSSKVCSRRMRTPYGPLRMLQLLSSITQVGILCGLFTYDPLWYYWIWLLVLPLCTLSTTSNQLCRYYNLTWGYGGGSDIAFAILYICHGGSIAGIYFGYYWFLLFHGWFLNIVYAALGLDAALSLLFWITGCSAACCKCLNHNMPEPGWH